MPHARTEGVPVVVGVPVVAAVWLWLAALRERRRKADQHTKHGDAALVVYAPTVPVMVGVAVCVLREGLMDGLQWQNVVSKQRHLSGVLVCVRTWVA
jgi:hypothetical protein